jgi:hypothetical protein
MTLPHGFWPNVLDGLGFGALWRWLRRVWCDWTHGGGDIKRDRIGRINWQCRKCGRWGTPVSAAEERQAIADDIMRSWRTK